MKSKTLITGLLIISLLSNCNQFELNQEPDPLIGKWIMFKKTKEGVNVPINECNSKTSIEFKPNKRYTETVFYKDSINDCKSYEDFGKWNLFNSEYQIDNLTIINQNRKIKIDSDILIYSYQAWSDPLGNLTTTDIVRHYEKIK